MALHWDITKVKNSTETCYVKGEDGLFTLRPITDIIIWTTLAVGLPTITEKNWPEWVWRLSVMNSIGHFLMSRDGKACNPTPQEIKAHIGLTTNAPLKTRLQFMKAPIGRALGEAADYAVKKAAAEAAVETAVS